MLKKKESSLLDILKTIIKATFIMFYLILLGGLIIGGISTGVLTLIPDEAKKPCYLGYYAHCSFTPFSTLILFVMAIIGTILLIKLVKYLKRKYEKAKNTKPLLQSLVKN